MYRRLDVLWFRCLGTEIKRRTQYLVYSVSSIRNVSLCQLYGCDNYWQKTTT